MFLVDSKIYVKSTVVCHREINGQNKVKSSVLGRNTRWRALLEGFCLDKRPRLGWR